MRVVAVPAGGAVVLIEDYFDDGPIVDCDCEDCLAEQDFAAWEAEVS